ncbi:MAG: type II toxin-antitoxin system toxin RelE3 [Sediminibacterium sp.]
MKVNVQKLFEKDIYKISDQKTARLIGIAMEEMEKADSLSDLRNIKKMVAKGNYYRMRIGNYRLGFKVETDTIVLLRFMHRKDIYSYFP